MPPMMNLDPRQLALQALMEQPQIANSPQGQEFLRILQSGDEQAGMQMAMNICNSYNCTPRQALMNAVNFFKGGRR